jgi:hypothetical protein
MILDLIAGAAVLLWLAFWVVVLVGRWEADPVAAAIAFDLFGGYLYLRWRRRSR